MGFKFAGTSPGNSAENHSATVTNGHMRRTIVLSTVRPAQPFWLSETLFLRVSRFFSVSFNGHIQWTVIPTTVRPAQPFWLSETLFLRVSHFFLSVLKRTLTTDRHTLNDPSFMTVMTVRDPSPRVSKFLLSVL